MPKAWQGPWFCHTWTLQPSSHTLKDHEFGPLVQRECYQKQWCARHRCSPSTWQLKTCPVWLEPSLCIGSVCHCYLSHIARGSPTPMGFLPVSRQQAEKDNFFLIYLIKFIMLKFLQSEWIVGEPRCIPQCICWFQSRPRKSPDTFWASLMLLICYRNGQLSGSRQLVPMLEVSGDKMLLPALK